MPAVCHYALAVMATAGLYETSGDWLYDIGLPGKSGIGGGIVTVSPGKGGLGTFAPPLDAAGNSVKGQLVAKFLSQRLGHGPVRFAPASDRDARHREARGIATRQQQVNREVSDEQRRRRRRCGTRSGTRTRGCR